ncbi:TetR/AcrR family transcriptional regulator [Gorillibacterium massiliense]|uniref:TetR/AcrR family transcriptional regulator n=1 Tax=Gorillibacterium massiliense TaxID=1280390 RepID=UPI0004B6D720|nr:TetR/AcrR family transcriptional regulator [Gorillibacterium massiliense]
MKQVRTSKGIVTKRNIEEAAGKLFGLYGYQGVTMREIAKEAGCSHTLIYMYYKDKEELLRQMASPLLEKLLYRIRQTQKDPALPPVACLQSISHDLVHFCLSQRSMVSILFANPPATSQGGLVIAQESFDHGPCIETLRNELYACIRSAVGCCLPRSEPDTERTFHRLYLFMLHGLVMSYTERNETAPELLERAYPLIDQGIKVLFGGIAPIGARESVG